MPLEALISGISIPFSEGTGKMYILTVLSVLLGDTYLDDKGEVGWHGDRTSST